MSSTYLGFDLGSMLHWISEYCTDVSIKKTGAHEWTMTTFSEKYGEFEKTGTMFGVTGRHLSHLLSRQE